MSNSGFIPNWFSPPGDTIRELLEDRGLSFSDFAERMDRSRSWVSHLLRGDEGITKETADSLQTVLGGSSKFWLCREAQFREDYARLATKATTEHEGKAWLKGLPLRDMKKFGWLDPFLSEKNDLEACVNFFGVPNVNSQVLESAAFMTSKTYKSLPGAAASWLRQGEIESASIDCNDWNKGKFRDVLSKIRTLTKIKDPKLFLPKLQKAVAACGVAVVVVRAPNGCRASGATRFISPNKALLLLSFRYLSDDHFWFAFFHEAGHLVLHDNSRIFLEGPGIDEDEFETEANEFAAQNLIPEEYVSELNALRANHHNVMRFATKIGIAPGIVVGQLQHLGLIRYNQLNRLKRKFTWGEG